MLTNEVLTRAEEIKPWLLPIDFAETEEALATNLKSRAAAKHHLMNGGCLIVFPAGGVSTTPTLWHRHATDAEWKKFTARLIAQCQAAVVPIFFAGQNSRLFQMASHVSMTLRLSLLFKEIRDRIGSEVHVRIGEVVPFAQISTMGDRQAVMNHLQTDHVCTGRRHDGAQAQAAADQARRRYAMTRVGLFITCLVDLMRPNVGFAAVKLLEAAGCQVEVPHAQTCCGQPAWNAGDDKNAAALARRVVDAFEDFDYVVVPSGSCAGMLRNHYPEALAGDPAYAARARALAARTHELVSFLVNERGMEHVLARCEAKACYHDSCSALREMGVKDEPRQLLKTVDGLELTELKDGQVCCGFGGLFAVKYPEISERMADDKIADAVGSGADTLIGPDLGCLLHLAGRMKRQGKTMRVRHVAEVLADMADGPALGDKT